MPQNSAQRRAITCSHGHGHDELPPSSTRSGNAIPSTVAAQCLARPCHFACTSGMWVVDRPIPAEKNAECGAEISNAAPNRYRKDAVAVAEEPDGGNGCVVTNPSGQADQTRIWPPRSDYFIPLDILINRLSFGALVPPHTHTLPRKLCAATGTCTAVLKITALRATT
jgi:hypothetical protein